jgi:hypothetical protein
LGVREEDVSMKKPAFIFISVFCFVLFLGAVSRVFAHDGQWGDANNPMDLTWDVLDLDHNDADPFKGWATLWVKNICDGDWGDFHLKIKKSIFDPFANIDNIDFSDVYDPELWVRTAPLTWERYLGLAWDIDNDVVGAEIDLFFYDNPIEVGQWAAIKVYTDNTTNKCDWFCIGACPTPVPEPATVLLLGLGGLALLMRRR